MGEMIFYFDGDKIRVGRVLDVGKSLGEVFDFVHGGVVLLKISKGKVVKSVGNVIQGRI